MRIRPLSSCLLVSFLLATVTSPVSDLNRVARLEVRVSADRADWTYSPGQPVQFTIAVLKDGHPASGLELSYEAGPEMMPPTIQRTVAFTGEPIRVEAGTMNEPGFLRCVATVKAEGKIYRGVCTAGFNPGGIQPVAENPSDFNLFWETAKKDLAQVPIEPRITLLPEWCTAKANVYQVSLRNVGGGNSRIYGILAEPKEDGRYPALLNVPGAGVRSYRGVVDLAEKGIITLQIGIHGVPVNLDAEVYEALRGAALAGYPTMFLDNRDRYYFRRVYLGCVRGNDFLVTHPKWDGKNLAVMGGSQGGALTIVTAGLDPRVTALVSIYPALSDLTGYLKGRAGGWPHMFRQDGEGSERTPEKITTSAYYDVVNFARRLKTPGFYTWGYNDEVCPPTSMYAAYNVIPAPKQLLLALETGHFTVPEQVDRWQTWLLGQLGVN
jgi:cephalosporin-C deacetylase